MNLWSEVAAAWAQAILSAAAIFASFLLIRAQSRSRAKARARTLVAIVQAPLAPVLSSAKTLANAATGQVFVDGVGIIEGYVRGAQVVGERIDLSDIEDELVWMAFAAYSGALAEFLGRLRREAQTVSGLALATAPPSEAIESVFNGAKAVLDAAAKVEDVVHSRYGVRASTRIAFATFRAELAALSLQKALRT